MKNHPDEPADSLAVVPNTDTSSSEIWQTMIEKHTRLIEESPASAGESYHQLAFAYYFLKQYENCLGSCEKVIELSQQPAQLTDAYLWKGRMEMDKKNYEEAIVHYLSCLTYDEHETALGEMGECYAALKQWEKAEHYYRRLLQLDGCEGWACSLLGEVFYDQKNYEQAREYFEKAVNQPSSYDAACYLGLGRIHAEQGDYDKAITVFKKGIALSPDDSNNYYCLGLCYQRLNDFYLAMHNYAEALRCYPNFPEVYNNMAVLYQQEGDYQAAIESLENALALSDDDSRRTFLYLNLVKLHQQVLEYDKVDYYKNELLQLLGFDFFKEQDDDGEGDGEEEDNGEDTDI